MCHVVFILLLSLTLFLLSVLFLLLICCFTYYFFITTFVYPSIIYLFLLLLSHFSFYLCPFYTIVLSIQLVYSLFSQLTFHLFSYCLICLFLKPTLMVHIIFFFSLKFPNSLIIVLHYIHLAIFFFLY